MAAIYGQHNHAPYTVYTHEDMPPPPSPTLTNPDLILPNESRYSVESPPQPDRNFSRPSSRTLTHGRQGSDESGAEFGVATAVVVPVRLSVGPPTNVSQSGHLLTYQGYEHGAPLSDIGEEETETEDESDRAITPKDLNRSPSPAEVDDIAAEVEKLAAPQLRHKKRLSNISVGSTGSDKAEWDKFDSTKLVNDRVAADIVQARNAADVDPNDGRRGSKESDEMSVLNDQAEQFLEKARKRLSHMEDNLSKARHSMLLSSSKSLSNMHETGSEQQPAASPHKPASQPGHNTHEVGLGQQPGGGLYRSISLSAQNRRSRAFPVKPNTTLSHGRAESDNVANARTHRQSRTPELRSASALEYSRPWLGATTPDRLQSSHSPSSSRSFNSPLRILSEEAESPSTVKTSPESGAAPSYAQGRGLGINAAATKAREDVSFRTANDRPDTSTSLERSNSQASTRSTRELKDQMSEMKSRIAELKNKAQADTLRRRSVQNLRSSSPFTGSSPENYNQWRSASPAEHDRAGTSLGHASSSGHGWRSISQQSHHQRKDSALDEDPTQSTMPTTPTTVRLMAHSTPAQTNSVRTDRNAPILAHEKRRQDNDPLEFDSHGAHSNYEEVEQNFADDDDDDEIYANEEEQIYLNEVLEESLHEPEVPVIPTAYLTQGTGAEERHEDRLDAFDYENMFLHSAMGTYTGHSDSDAESDVGSVETSRQDNATPIAEDESDNSDDNSDPEQDLNTSDRDQSDDSTPPSPSSPISSHNSPVKQSDGSMSIRLKPPKDPWAKLGRSNSMDSESSAATFETATEGHDRDFDDDDDDSDSPEEILNWGNDTGHHLSTLPKDQTLASSPLGAAVGVPREDQQNTGHGMILSSNKSPAHQSKGNLSQTEFNLSQSRSSIPTTAKHGSYSSHYEHRRSVSNDTDDSTEDQKTPVATTFSQHQSSLPRPRGLHKSSSSTSSARHLRNASSSTTSTARQSLIQAPAAKQTPPSRTSSAQSHRRLGSRGLKMPSAIAMKQPSPIVTKASPQSTHAANTEILMESLIKLADPSFSIRPDTRFAEVDKELVLNLLRALGGVCDGILRAEKQGESSLVKELRGRLRDGEEVLFHGLGADEEEDEDDQTESGQIEGDDFDDNASDVQTVRGLGINGAVHG